MNNNLGKTLILSVVLSFIAIDLSFSRSVGQFCDNNFVDAVLWDGITYRLTRNEWIATYNPESRTVGPLSHLSDDSFQNEKGYYYQSVYHIPIVPECTETTMSCQMMERLQGLTVFAIRRYFSSDKQTFDVIHRIYRNGNIVNPLTHDIQDDINIQKFIESNLLPKRSHQKYRPSVYSPKDFTFIHITNQYQNFGPLLETIQLQTNGVVERSYHQLNEFTDIVFITSFWWAFDQKVYIIGEHKSGVGNPFIYELELKNHNINLKPINKSVLQFFGCHTSGNNRLAQKILKRISSDDLGLWRVHTLDETSVPSQNKVQNEVNQQKAKHENYTDHQNGVTVQPTPSPFSVPITDTRMTNSPIIDHTINQWSDRSKTYTTNQKSFKSEYRMRATTDPNKERGQYVSTYIPISQTEPTVEQRNHQTIDYSSVETVEQRNGNNFDGTATDGKPSTVRESIKKNQTIDLIQNITENNNDISIVKADAHRMRKYVNVQVTGFWKIFPIVVMLCLLVFSILILILGFVAVLNMKTLLTNKIKNKKSINNSFNGVKNHRLKYDDRFNDFFIEEYDTSPKQRFQSVDNNSCQTNESFEIQPHNKADNEADCEAARTIL